MWLAIHIIFIDSQGSEVRGLDSSEPVNTPCHVMVESSLPPPSRRVTRWSWPPQHILQHLDRRVAKILTARPGHPVPTEASRPIPRWTYHADLGLDRVSSMSLFRSRCTIQPWERSIDPHMSENALYSTDSARSSQANHTQNRARARVNGSSSTGFGILMTGLDRSRLFLPPG